MSILVIGGTGNLGPHVVRSLLARGAEVGVLTRDPIRAAAILPAEARTIGVDGFDEVALRAAASDASALFLLTSHGPDMAGAQLRILRALRGVDAPVVKLSATDATVHADGPGVGRQHWEVEQVLAASGRPFTVLRPNAFVQGIVERMIVPVVRGGAALTDPTAGASPTRATSATRPRRRSSTIRAQGARTC